MVTFIDRYIHAERKPVPLQVVDSLVGAFMRFVIVKELVLAFVCQPAVSIILIARFEPDDREGIAIERRNYDTLWENPGSRAMRNTI